MTDMQNIKEMIQCATFGITKRMKNAISISIAFCHGFFIINENVTSEECRTKNPFEIILHVGRVTSLRSWVAEKSCHSQTVINEQESGNFYLVQ